MYKNVQNSLLGKIQNTINNLIVFYRKTLKDSIKYIQNKFNIIIINLI